jgi:collagenase-like PrtC family protease
MKILSPANGADEVSAVIKAGAGEIYCGVMPAAWRKAYTNVASPNRREWAVSNMTSFDTLAECVRVAHDLGVPVFFTMNALYTESQYDEVIQLVEESRKCGVDAIIVADLGLLLKLPELGWDREIHISTGGTTFNNETVAFYKALGAKRVIIPRHNRVSEIAEIARSNPDIDIETFVMNTGCKNIDGFCTFHHGVNEVRIPLWWNIPKKLHLDYYLLNLMKRLPLALRNKLAHTSMFGSVGACYLAYDVEVRSETADAVRKQTLKANLENNFNLFTGFDTCGACALYDLNAAGVESLKIVGRSNPLHKKLKDVRFLSRCLQFIEHNAPTREQYVHSARRMYATTYGFACHDWCYFPEQDAQIGVEVL